MPYQHYFHKQYQNCSKHSNIKSLKLRLNNTNTKPLFTQHTQPSFPQSPPQQFVCLSTGNILKIFKLTSESVDYYMKKQFFCNIHKIQIIPSLHSNISDYIFILDNLGRYCFWRPDNNQYIISNQILKQYKNNNNKYYYKEEISPQQQEEYCGGCFYYDVKDTYGYVFFTVGNKIVLLNVEIKLNCGLRVLNKRILEIPYTRFRYVNCLNYNTTNNNNNKNSSILIGIIQQIQQKTILKIHRIQPQSLNSIIDQQTLQWKLQKINLLSFKSGNPSNDQIIILTYDQITIYKYKNNNYICNYRTRGNYGAGGYVGLDRNIANINNLRGMVKEKQSTYIHLGYDMKVFNKNKMYNYGTLKLNGKNILQDIVVVQCVYLGHLSSSNQFVIGFINNFNEVYFVALSQTKWRLIRKIKSLSSIFSLHQVNTNNYQHINNNNNINDKLIAVHSASQQHTQISLIEVLSQTKIQEQQIITKIVEYLQSIRIDKQQYLIMTVGLEKENIMLKWSQKQKCYLELYRSQFVLPKQQILACCNQYFVFTSGIYKYQTSPRCLSLLLKQENILSAVFNSQYIGYYTSQGLFKYYSIQTESISRIRKNCSQEYIWDMLSTNINNDNILISATYSQIGKLRIMPIQKIAKTINLQIKELISSLGSINYNNNNNNKINNNNHNNNRNISNQSQKRQIMMLDQNQQLNVNDSDKIYTDIVIGYYNGDLEIYSLQYNKTIAKFRISSEMVKISNFKYQNLIVYTANKQFVLSRFHQKRQNNNTNNGQYSSSYELHQIQLSDSANQIAQVEYLLNVDKFLILSYNQQRQESIIQLRRLQISSNTQSQQSLTLQLASSISITPIFTSSHQQIPYVETYGSQSLYIILNQQILKYSLITKQRLKIQIHLLKQIIAIDKSPNGLLVTGIDIMQYGSVVLFNYNDLSIISTYNLGKNKPTALKVIKQRNQKEESNNNNNNIKNNNSDRFFLRYQNYLVLMQIQPLTKSINQLKTINTKCSGYSIDVHQECNKILLTDPYKYFSVYDYQLGGNFQILPISKHFGAFTINQCKFIDNSIIYGDHSGRLNILEFNLENQNSDIHKCMMSNVGEIYIGEEVFTIKRGEDQDYLGGNQSDNNNKIKNNSNNNNKYKQIYKGSAVYYGCSSGMIGQVRTISEEDFVVLKKIQEDVISYIDMKQYFSYQQWRLRNVSNDKIIDQYLIRFYLSQFNQLNNNNNNEQFYNRVKIIYDRCIS